MKDRFTAVYDCSLFTSIDFKNEPVFIDGIYHSYFSLRDTDDNGSMKYAAHLAVAYFVNLLIKDGKAVRKIELLAIIDNNTNQIKRTYELFREDAEDIETEIKQLIEKYKKANK